MDVTESCVPPGFRFHPTDEELVGYYLKKKVASERIDLDVIRDIDLYRIEPWDLQERCRIWYEEQNEWYFFSHKDKKYPTGTRTNRATMAGFWKATGRDKAVHEKNRLIGMRKTLVFYQGRAPNGQKTDWIMHEYRLETNDNNGPPLPQEEGWVVCRAFKKRTPNCHVRITETWDPPFPYNAPTTNHFQYHQSQTLAAVCKQELDFDHFLLANQHLLDLPQLESPSLPPPKRPNSVGNTSARTAEKAMDWKALDKFVASQLSPEELVGANYEEEEEMALLLLGGGGEENKLDGLLRVFEK